MNRWILRYETTHGRTRGARKSAPVWPEGEEPEGIHRASILNEEVVEVEGKLHRVVKVKAIRMAGEGSEAFVREVAVPKTAKELEVVRV